MDAGTGSNARGLVGRQAVVTGGTGALGRVVTRLLLEAGAVVTAAARDPARAAGLGDGLPAEARARLHGAVADVTDEAEVRRLVTAVSARTPTVDVLVNVVGGFAPGSLSETDAHVWDHMLAVNLRSAYLVTRGLLPLMIAAGSGRIVYVASRSVLPPRGGFIAYTVAKAGLIALAQALAQELQPHRITVNTVLPSTMDTAANRRAMPGADAADWVAPEAVAEAIRFLASDAASGVTGALVTV